MQSHSLASIVLPEARGPNSSAPCNRQVSGEEVCRVKVVEGGQDRRLDSIVMLVRVDANSSSGTPCRCAGILPWPLEAAMAAGSGMATGSCHPASQA